MPEGLTVIQEMPFSVSEYTIDKYIQNTFRETFLALIARVNFALQLGFYDNYPIYEYIPPLWLEVSWILSHKNEPPPDEIILEFADNFAWAIKQIEHLPILTFDCFYLKALEWAIEATRNSWMQPIDYEPIDCKFRELVAHLTRTKFDFVHGNEMTYQ